MLQGQRARSTTPKGFSNFSPSFNFPLRPLAGCKLIFKEVVFILQVRIGINVPSVTPWVKREKQSHPKAALQSPQTLGGEGTIWPHGQCIPELPLHTPGAPTGYLPLCCTLETQRSAGPHSLSLMGRKSHLPAQSQRQTIPTQARKTG